MRFGIEFGSYPSDLPPVEVCQQVTERALVAQRNNFDALFVAQHFLTGPDAAILQSMLTTHRLKVTENVACDRGALQIRTVRGHRNWPNSPTKRLESL